MAEYAPKDLPTITTLDELKDFVNDELRQVSKVFAVDTPVLNPQHVEPARPREGMMAYADGTNWDPGFGAGHYGFVVDQWLPMEAFSTFTVLMDTRAQIAATEIPAYVTAILTAGYTDVGDGGQALYVRSVGATIGGVQSADGQHWKLAGQRWTFRMFGAKGDGSNDSVGCQDAIDLVGSVGGGVIYPEVGLFYVPSGLTQPSNVTIEGAGKDTTIIDAHDTDVTVLTSEGSLCHLTVLGKGTNGDTGSFGATQPTLVWNGAPLCFLRDVRVWGGAGSLVLTSGSDAKVDNVDASLSYSSTNVSTTGSNWYRRGKFDQDATGIAPTNSPPYPAWAAATAYTVGQVRIHPGGFKIQCSVAGTSGGSAPTLKNYGIAIPDGAGTLQWLLVAPEIYVGLAIADGALENRFEHTDLTGFGYDASLVVDAVNSVTRFTDGVIAQPVSVSDGSLVRLQGTDIGADVDIDTNYPGRFVMDCDATGAINLTIGNNVSDFSIAGDFGGGTITVGTGCDDYVIAARNVTVTDNSANTNKRVQPTDGTLAKSSFSVHKNGTDQTGISSATFTTVTWSTETYDISSHFASNTWTPPKGKVALTACIIATGTFAAGNVHVIAIAKNGTPHKQFALANALADAVALSIAIEDVANGTDAYTIQAFITTDAGTATIVGDSVQSYFMGHWIGS